MKIGIEATSAAEAQKAGVGYYTLNVLRALSHLQADNYTYTLYLRTSWGFSEDLSSMGKPQQWNVRVLRSPLLWAQLRLPLELRQHPQDVYFFPTAVLPIVHQPANSVLTIHDVAFLFFPECFSFALRSWLALACKIGMARARKIITVSEATRQDVLAHYGVNPDKVVTIHHGVHERFTQLRASSMPSIEQTKRKYGIQHPYILCIGTLQRRKNIPRLLQAFYLLKQRYQIPHQLVLVGQQYKDLPEHEIFATIQRLILNRDVVWTGYVDEQDMPFLLNGAELFVLPSLYEGFGMPLVEAMACGVPVACSNTSSLPEVVGEAGALFEPDDVEHMAMTLHQVLTQKRLSDSLRVQGLRRAREFSWEACARKTLGVLEEVGRA
jgi:glycosyltransferase involved in cell wall biosynthesis